MTSGFNEWLEGIKPLGRARGRKLIFIITRNVKLEKKAILNDRIKKSGTSEIIRSYA